MRGSVLVVSLLLAGCVTTSEQFDQATAEVEAAPYEGPAFTVEVPTWEAGVWWAYEVDGQPVRFTVLNGAATTNGGPLSVLGVTAGTFDVEGEHGLVAVRSDDLGTPSAWRTGLPAPEPMCVDACTEDAWGKRVDDVALREGPAHHAMALFPLEGGKRFRTTLEATEAICDWFLFLGDCERTSHTKEDLVGEVKGPEAITVAAGAFEAVRIEVYAAHGDGTPRASTMADPLVIHYAEAVEQVVRVHVPDWIQDGTLWVGGRDAELVDHGTDAMAEVHESRLAAMVNELHVRQALETHAPELTVSGDDILISGDLDGPVEPASLGASAHAGDGLTDHHAVALSLRGPEGALLAQDRQGILHGDEQVASVVALVDRPGAYAATGAVDYFGRIDEDVRDHVLADYHGEGRATCDVPIGPVIGGGCEPITFPVAPGQVLVTMDTDHISVDGGRLVLRDAAGEEVAAVEVAPGQASATLDAEVDVHDEAWTAAWEPAIAVATYVDMGVDVDVVAGPAS